MVDQPVTAADQKNVQRVRFPIRKKITVPYLILLLTLAVVAAYGITEFITKIVEERFNKQLFEAGKISSELIVGYETQLLETQRLLANVNGVASALLANDPDRLKILTLGIIVNDQQDDVEFLNTHGNQVLSIHHRSGGNQEDYEFSTGGQTIFSNLEITQNILAGKSDARGDKFAGYAATDFGKFLYVSGPIYDGQHDLVGVVLVGRSLPTLAADMHSKTLSQISFYDQSGHILYSTLLFPHELTLELAQSTISLKDVSSTKRDFSNQRDLGVSDISFSEILGAWEVRGDHQIGILGIALSKNVLVATSTESRWRIFLLVFGSELLIILLGIYFADTITRPLLKLVQASRKVAEDDLTVIVDAQSNDEVSVLTDTFNTMVASLSLSNSQLIQSYDKTLEGWAKALELRENETENHSARVTNLTIQLAQTMGINGQKLVNIRRGALLHDIGKIGTPDSILHKNGSLDYNERQIIQRHSQDGYNILKQIGFFGPSLEIPFCHHEKWDGTGYPRGLKGEEIPLSARIFAVVDVFDAMSNDRPYRKALPIDEVIKYLDEHSGSHFDPTVIEVFFRIINVT